MPLVAHFTLNNREGFGIISGSDWSHIISRYLLKHDVYLFFFFVNTTYYVST